MYFTSLPFVAFLLGLLILYYALPQTKRWYALLAGSFIFYAYAGLSFLFYIGATIVTTYCITLHMRRLRVSRDAELAACADKEARKQCKAHYKTICWRWLLVCLFINFGLLAVIKYTNFFIINVNALLDLWKPDTQLRLMHFLAPLGMSFYTFQSMGYAIDCYREKSEPETNLLRFALFVSFFPQVIQGPISRHNDLSKTLYAGGPFNGRNISFGAQRVLWGFFKKLVIADRLLPVVQSLTAQPDTYQGVYVLTGMLLYAITLYADFTGGIDITIGVAEMFGVRVTENFDRPFYSMSIAEYWRRWHITMGTWFRDYIFYPISVCKPMLRFSKNTRARLGEKFGKRVPVYVSMLTVWFLTGLWHGATWNFIVWGLANGLVIAVSQEFQPLYNRFHARFAWAESKGYHAFQIFRTFWLMCFIRSFDCYVGVGTTFRMMGTVFANFSLSAFLKEGLGGLGLNGAGYVSAGLGLAVVLLVSFLQRNGEDVRKRLSRVSWPARYAVVSAVIFMIVIFGAYGIGYDARQFIYNRF